MNDDCKIHVMRFRYNKYSIILVPTMIIIHSCVITLLHQFARTCTKQTRCIKQTPYMKWTLERVPWASTLNRFHCHLFLNLILLNQSKNKLNKVVMQLFIWAWLGSTRCSSKQNTSRSKSNKRLRDDVKTTVVQTQFNKGNHHLKC